MHLWLQQQLPGAQHTEPQGFSLLGQVTPPSLDPELDPVAAPEVDPVVAPEVDPLTEPLVEPE